MLDRPPYCSFRYRVVGLASLPGAGRLGVACDPSVYVPHLIAVVALMIYRFAGFKVGHPWTLVAYLPHCCHCVVRWCMRHDKNCRDERSDKRRSISMSVNRPEPSLEMSTTSGAHTVSSRSTCSMSEQKAHHTLHAQLVRVQPCSPW